MVFRSLSIFLILLVTYFSLREKKSEYSRYNLVQNYLGTRTPYRFKYNKNDTKLSSDQCTDSKIWMIIRHGTRLPSSKDIIGMNTILKEIKQKILSQHHSNQGTLNAEQIKMFNEWHSDLDSINEKKLTEEGEDEMVLLAERVQNRFPNAISKSYTNNTFMFRYTATQRAQQSARYFTFGLFDKKDADKVVFVPATKVDPILRFYKHCDRWQNEVKKNSSTYLEQKLFGKSQEINDTLKKVSSRLGLNYLLTLDEVSLMFKICGYETSWDKHNGSPWCNVLDAEDAQRLEYYYDLKHYWIDGYGYDLTHRLGCLSINTMFEQFTKFRDTYYRSMDLPEHWFWRFGLTLATLARRVGEVVSANDKAPNATFLFAHSGTLLKILSYLNLYNSDPPLRGDKIQENRVWRATNIDCFASNLAFVLYRCKEGDKILTIHQERPIKLPMCETELCPLETIRNYYSDTIDNCDISQMCNIQ